MAGEIQIAGNFVGTGALAAGSQITTAPSTTATAGLTVPPGTPPTTPNPGDMYFDNTRKNLGIAGIGGGASVWLQGCVQTQQQQSAVPGVVGNPQTLVSFNALDAGILASVGKRLILTGSGQYTSAVAEIPTVGLNLFLLTKKLILVSSDAIAASQTNAPFWFHFELLTVTAAGASSSVRASAVMHMMVSAGVVKTYLYCPNSPTLNIDLSSPGAPLIQVEVTGTGLTGININEASLHITN